MMIPKYDKTSIRRRRGFALMLVMVQVALLSALWGVAYRQLGSAVRINAAMAPTGGASAESPTAIKPMARALSLLETGDPPADPSTWGVTILAPGGPVNFAVRFQSQSSGDPNSDGSPKECWAVRTWRVPSLSGLTPLPDTFAPN